MNRTLIFAATLVMATAAIAPEAANAAQQQPAKPAVGRFVGTPLVAGHKAFQQMDYALALAKGQEADAVTNKTPYEEYQVARLLGISHLRLGNFSAAVAAYDRAVASGSMPPEDAARLAQERAEALARSAN